MKTRAVSKTSPQVYARVAGLLYLTVIIAGLIAQLGISGRIVVEGDAGATAANILSQRDLFQLGFTIYLIEMISQFAQAILFYILLKPVNRTIALLAVVINLAGCLIKTLSRAFYLSPLLILGGSHYLHVFDAGQLQALALFLLNLNSQMAGMALAFFGVSTALNGALIFQSGFLPRFLGVLSMLGGLGWLTFFYPPLGLQLFSYIAPVALLGSTATILWLLIKGVNAEQWNQRAAA